MVVEVLKIGTGGCLVVFAVLATGTANAKIQTVGTPDPSTTEQAIIRQEQPGKFYQLGGGFVSLGSGLFLIGSGIWGIMKAGEAPQNEMHVPVPVPTSVQAPPSSVPLAAQHPHLVRPESSVDERELQLQEEVDYAQVPAQSTALPVPPPPPPHLLDIQAPVDTNFNGFKQTHIAFAEETQEDFESVTCPEDDKYQQLRDLVYENSIGIVGFEKGSGKTSKLAYLAAEHIKLGHKVEIVNPLAIGKHWKGLKVWGRGGNFVDAANGIRRFTKIMKARLHKRGDPSLDYDPFDEEHLFLAIDELSNYGEKIDEVDETVMPGFWEVSTQYLRQANGSFAFASHGKTQTMLGGAKALAGKSETIQKGIVWLFAQAQTDNSVRGGKRCAGWAYLQKPSNDETSDGRLKKEKIFIPEWAQAPNPEFDFRSLVQKHCPQFLFEEKAHRMPDSRDKSPSEFKEELQDYWKNNEEIE
jgi:hypothetical protein